MVPEPEFGHALPLIPVLLELVVAIAAVWCVFFLRATACGSGCQSSSTSGWWTT